MFIEIYIDYTKLREQAPRSFEVGIHNGYYQLGKNSDGLFISLRERDAYPGTYFQAEDDAVVFGYGQQNPHEDDEFLQAAITAGGDMAIQRDMFATLPLFYSYSDYIFIASNSYEAVVSQTKQLTLNKFMLREILAPNPDRHQDIWNEIKMLDERHSLRIEAGKLYIDKPAAREWLTSKDAASQDPKRFSRTFSTHLDNCCQAVLKGQTVGFEVSGGIDSATLPLYAAKKGYAQNAMLGSMQFPGEFGETQTQKIMTLQDATNAQAVTAKVSTAEDIPLSRIVSQKPYKPFYAFEEIYAECVSKLAIEFQKRGVEVVATGIGGDELFENNLSAENELKYGKTERSNRQKKDYPPFLTEKFIAEYVGSTPDEKPYPMPLLGNSYHRASYARNNIYIEHGIWPVSPFANAKLYEFCQGLPAHFRANKNILRAFHQAQKFPEIIYRPVQNEHFGKFFDESLASDAYVNLVQELLPNSVMVREGYVNGEALQKLMEECRSNPDTQSSKWLLHVFTWVIAELNIAVEQTRH